MALVQTDPIGSKILHQYLDTWWSSDFHCFSSKRVCPFYDISIYSLYSSIFILRIHTFYHVRKADLVTYLYFYFSSMQAHCDFCMQKCCAYWVKSLKSAFTWAYHHITTHAYQYRTSFLRYGNKSSSYVTMVIAILYSNRTVVIHSLNNGNLWALWFIEECVILWWVATFRTSCS